jgi:hypothetical protein
VKDEFGGRAEMAGSGIARATGEAGEWGSRISDEAREGRG